MEVGVTAADISSKAIEAHLQGRLVDAERLYRQALANQSDGSIAANLGAILRQQGRLRDAKTHYLWALDNCSWHPSLSLNAANCFQALGDHDLCEKTLREALTNAPKDTNLLQALGSCHIAQKRPFDALRILVELSAMTPAPPNCWRQIGLCWCQLKRTDKATHAFKQALEQNRNDEHSAGQLIIQLKDQGNYEEARVVFESLSKSTQNKPPVKAGWAAWHLGKGKIEAAAQLYASLCNDEPLNGDHWLNLACCQREIKQVVAPWDTIRAGLRKNPHHEGLQLALLQVASDLGDRRLTGVLVKNWLGNNRCLNDNEHRSIQFLGAGYRLLPTETLKTLAQAWEEKKTLQGPKNLWQDLVTDEMSRPKLRVGYISSDFCQHPVGRFIKPLLQNHDRKKFWVLGAHTGAKNDALTESLRSYCDNWLELGFCNDVQAGRLIADQQLDVLIELGGYTGGSRMSVLVHRPAPVQLSYLGYFAPTHLQCIDGWIGDQVLFESLDFTEAKSKQLIVQGGYMTFPDMVSLPKVTTDTSRPFRFGCLNNSRKLTDETIRLFSQVMAAVPQAELALKSISFHELDEIERIRTRLEAGGIAKDRIQILPWSDTIEHHLQSYREVDVALDPIPYGGATTTCEALAMGVPVITIAGEGMVGRLSASILHYSNNKQWIAKDQDAYISIAKKLEEEGVRGNKARKQLRHKVKTSNLGDARRLARELETLLFDLIAKKR